MLILNIVIVREGKNFDKVYCFNVKWKAQKRGSVKYALNFSLVWVLHICKDNSESGFSSGGPYRFSFV